MANARLDAERAAKPNGATLSPSHANQIQLNLSRRLLVPRCRTMADAPLPQRRLLACLLARLYTAGAMS
eukprot:11173893-Lingulodinium_polyedra.AAC.1